MSAGPSGSSITGAPESGARAGRGDSDERMLNDCLDGLSDDVLDAFVVERHSKPDVQSQPSRSVALAGMSVLLAPAFAAGVY